MRLAELREQVVEANLELARSGLAPGTFGNASGIDRGEGVVAIKPSGVSYERLTAATLVLTDLEGRIVEGELRPSSDLPTHLALYRAWAAIGGVAHTHSEYATTWAQAGWPIPCLGTTHADHYPGPVPITDWLTEEAIAGAYERETGAAIVNALEGMDPAQVPGALVRGHGPFCWGKDAAAAVEEAVALETIARLAYRTLQLEAAARPLARALHDKHFQRKHGPAAYYGQP
jgi:L-ribulose-5-phosphate 4-epimerase